MIQQFQFWVSKESENTNSKGYMHHRIHRSVIHNSQDTETAEVPNNRRMDK